MALPRKRWSTSQKKLHEQIQAELRSIRLANQNLRLALTHKLPRVVQNAGQIVEARAKEIITEKGHIVTGNLRRSISTSIVEVSEQRVRAEVGTWVEYAPHVEALPDGGYLYPAAMEKFDEVVAFLADNGVVMLAEEYTGPLRRKP